MSEIDYVSEKLNMPSSIIETYSINTSQIAGNANENIILHVNNNTTRDLVIRKIEVTGHDSDGRVLIYADSEYLAGGVEGEAVNHNRKTGGTVLLDIYINGGIDVDGGYRLFSGMMNKNRGIVKFNETIILGPDNSLDIRYSGTNEGRISALVVCDYG